MNKLKMKSLVICLLVIFNGGMLVAQELHNSDTIPGIVKSLVNNTSILSKLKFSGIIQAQWQKADTIGSLGKFSGGNFTGYDNRYLLRRGRFKAEYNDEFSRYVIQIDVTQSGVAIKDAYAEFTDPWLKTFSLTGGVFNRPFGYEIGYSSGSLESPERSRIIQTLFPGEEDLGAQLAIQAPSTSPLNFIKLQGGLFTGNGLNPETDKYKDFIGQVILKKKLSDALTISGGASYYSGGIAAVNSAGNFGKTSYAYLYDNISNGAYTKDSVKGGAKIKREYIGVDLQIGLHTIIGSTILRGEYITGTQPGTASINYSPTNDQPTPFAATTTTVTTYDLVQDSLGKYVKVPIKTSTVTTKPAHTDYYLRPFSGGYLTLIQSLGKSKHSVVLKYEWYDPNTKLNAEQVKTIGDVKFTTIGIGWIYNWNSHLKLTANYEIVKNEKTSTPLTTSGINGTNNYSQDLKDNVFTLRVQYRF